MLFASFVLKGCSAIAIDMKYSVLFCPDAKGHLRMYVRYLGKRICFNVGFRIEPDKWDKSTQRCRRNTFHGADGIPATRINARIQSFENSVDEVANISADGISVDNFRIGIAESLGRMPKEEQRESYYGLYREYLRQESLRCGWSKGLIDHHRILIADWEAFVPDMSIDKIGCEILEEFRVYLVNKGLQNITISKKLSQSKWFFRWLVGKGKLDNLQFTAYSPKLKRASRAVIFLTWEELMLVYNHPLSSPHLERARDVFCFCCFTSLRYSDAHSLRKKDIYGDMLHITTQKTNDKLEIELNDYSRSILAKYESSDSDMALPVISNQKMNVYLKEICRECGIDELITETYYVGTKKHEVTKPKWQMVGTHCGRRTFICNALMLGISPNIVMKWTGHSDYSSMKPYIDIADKVKKKAMSLFNK